MARILPKRLAGYLAAAGGIGAVTAVCLLLGSRINEMTVALAMLVVVLFVATFCELGAALVASVLGMLLLNYFFLPPIYSLTIADPKNWMALGAFFITALTAGRLSSWAKRQAAEAEASRSQARLASTYNRSLLEATLDPLMTIGQDGKINDVNAAAESVTGCPRGELIGSAFQEFFTEPEKGQAAYEQVLREGAARSLAMELRHRNGHSTSVLVDGSLYRDAEGHVIGVVAAIRPIRTYVGKPLQARPDPRVIRHLDLLVTFASLFSVAVGLLSIAGLVFRIAMLKSVVPGQPVIKMNTAVCLVFLGLSLWMARKVDRHARITGLSRQILAGAVALMGLLALTEHLFGWDLGIDQLLFREPAPDTLHSFQPGLVAPIAAAGLLLLGLALLLLDRPVTWRARRYWPAQQLASLTAILAIVGLLDFILGSQVSYTHMALQTAITLLVVSLSLLCTRTDRGLAALLASSTEGGVLTRRWVPAAILIPIVIGAVSWHLLSATRYSEAIAVTLMTVAMITLLAGFAIWNGYVVNRGDVERRRAEVSLQRNEMELREAQRLAHVGNWWWDPKGGTVAWSAGMSHLTWRDPMLPPPTYQEHLGFYNSESSARLDAAIQRALRTGASFELELKMIRADGAERTVTGRGEAERDAGGRVVLVRGMVEDITERKQADERLARSAEEIRDLYNHAPCGYHSLDKDGVFVRINDTELEWLQYRREEVIGKRRFTDLLTPDGLQTFTQSFPAFLAQGAAQDLEFDLVRKDGTSFPVLVSASALTNAAGDYLMSRSTVYDITERKRKEEELRESEANLNRAQEIAHIGSWHLDVGRNRLTWSDEVFRMFGVPKGTTLTYDAFVGMILPEDREAVEKAWAAALDGAPYDIEHRIVVHGTEKWVRERAQVEFDQAGKALEGIGTVQDITERKHAENEILQAEAALRRSNRAHRALSRCNQALVRATDEGALLQQVCQLIVEEAGYRFCWVGHAEQDEPKTVRALAQAGFEEGYLATVNLTWQDTERGRGPTGTAIRTGQTQVVANFATDPRLALWRPEALKRGYLSSVAIPLIVDSKTFGALTIYSADAEAFGAEELDLLTELAADLGYGITTLHTRAERQRAEEEVRVLNTELEQRVVRRTAQLQAANREIEQAREREIEIGNRIQQTLLLDQPPRDVPGLRVAALTIPSQRIDGDFYVFLRHSKDCLDVIVGDVMGKGIAAALLGAATKSHFLRALSDLMSLSKEGTLPEPKDIVMLAHAELAPHLIELDSFVTLCYTRLDVARRRLVLVDCGHTGLIHQSGRTGLCEVLHGDNMPLGVHAGEIYDQITVPFEPGDLLLFYSDGITEARNTSGELFGAQRLEEYVRQNGALDAGALVEGIRKAIFAFSGSDQLADDLTGVAIRLEETQPALAHREAEISSDPKELRRVREFIYSFNRAVPAAALDEDGAGALTLAVNEAASNIMRHAYHGRTDQWIQLEAEAFPTHLSVQLHYFGDPFDPAAVPPPLLDGSRESGFGAYIISRSVDEVRYYRDDHGRNCVALIKFRKPQSSLKGNAA